MTTLFLNLRLFALVTSSFFILSVKQMWVSILYLFTSKSTAHRLIDIQIKKDASFSFRFIKTLFPLRYDITKDPNAHIIPNRTYLIVANHQSFMDIPGIVMFYKNYCNRPIRFIAKKSLSRFFPHVSQLMRIQRYGFIDRTPGARTIRAIKQFSHRCESVSSSLVIFPEGTRSKDGSLRAFNTAAVRTALSITPLPLLVVAIDGGSRFSRLFHVSHARVHYRVKCLAIFDDINIKNTKEYLEKARSLIAKQISLWRSL